MRRFQEPGEPEVQRKRRSQLEGVVPEGSTLQGLNRSLGKVVLQTDGSSAGPLFSYSVFSQAVSPCCPYLRQQQFSLVFLQ